MRTSKGFTLIEVIVTLIVMAMAATIFITYMGIGFTRSGLPARQTIRQYNMIQQMEEITSEYRKEIAAGTLNLDALKTYALTRSYSDKSGTTIAALSDSTNTYTTQNVLIVRLTDGEQSLVSIFSK